MKPFDLAQAKAGKPVCTRDGYEVEILKFDLKDEDDYPIVVIVKYPNDSESVEQYTIEGKLKPNGIISGLDLMMKSTTKEGWINIYSNGYVGCLYDTEYLAKLEGIKSPNYITTIKIQWEE